MLLKERANELAMQVLQEKIERDGELKLIPSEIKRTVHNLAKKMNIPPQEIAGLIKIVLEKAYLKTATKLDEIINSGKVEE
ncbi:MAG: hypothetical protein U9R00_02780 [Patescibacteria group bacterium]|nr:hypothetical protein [Patescibacteria group bacterium]